MDTNHQGVKDQKQETLPSNPTPLWTSVSGAEGGGRVNVVATSNSATAGQGWANFQAQTQKIENHQTNR